MTESTKPGNPIALIAPPWPLYNRPSIQLGALKAYLQSTHAGLAVDARHFYLQVAQSLGYPLYQQISERTWLAESIYAALLFPDRFEIVEALFKREAGSKPDLKKIGLAQITSRVEQTTQAFLSGLRWDNYMLAGISVSLCQLTSALYLVKRFKQRYPGLTIVLGGSSFAGNHAGKIFNLFPEVNAVVNGEGEMPLSQIIDRLQAGDDPADLPPMAGVITPGSIDGQKDEAPFDQLEHLNQLPPPDYDDYFELLKSFAPPKVFFPVLPVETSRGCWWQSAGPLPAGTACQPTAGHASGCAFCNLNRQWQGYRYKDAGAVVEEIDHLTARHEVLAVSVVDNVLPKKSSQTVFKKLVNLKKDLHLFAEIRANTSAAELEVMKAAGVQELQIGIEALSTSLLKKLHKGTRAIQNLEIMRDCEALGIENSSNLILHFPTSDEQDVAETLRNLDFALPFRPLKTVNFWLGLESPVWHHPNAYGIKAVYNHPNWSRLFPVRYYRNMQFAIQAYRGDLGLQRKLWRPVKKKVAWWQKSYAALRRESPTSSILSFRDGRDFLIINQRRYQAEAVKHRLVGTSRLIYLFCMRHRSLRQICSRFPAFAEDKILAFLNMMTAKKLMFEEKGRYLSLAVPARRDKNRRLKNDD